MFFGPATWINGFANIWIVPGCHKLREAGKRLPRKLRAKLQFMVWGSRGSGAPGAPGAPGLPGLRAPRWWVGDEQKSRRYKFIFQISVLISKKIMFSKDEERGVFDFHAGLEKNLWTLSEWESGDLGYRVKGLLYRYVRSGLALPHCPLSALMDSGVTGWCTWTLIKSECELEGPWVINGQLWEWVMWCGFGRWEHHKP